VYARRTPDSPEDLIVPHQYLGADCCGCLFPFERDGLAEIVCNECDEVITTVPVDQARNVLERIAAERETAITSHTCPHCGSPNMFPGFSAMLAYTCRHCGAGVTVESPHQ
jgi:DNA-directed RNA polymerase subunit RPC12/RpoP